MQTSKNKSLRERTLENKTEIFRALKDSGTVNSLNYTTLSKWSFISNFTSLTNYLCI